MLKVMSFWQSFSKKTILVLASSSKILGVVFMCVGWILSFSCSRNLLGGCFLPMATAGGAQVDQIFRSYVELFYQREYEYRIKWVYTFVYKVKSYINRKN